MKIETPYFIAEIGLNHDGDMKKALQMIKESKKAGANAVKFQSINTQELVSPFTFNIKGEVTGENQFFTALQKLEITQEDHKTIRDLCNELKIDFISSPFDIKSLNWVGEYCDAIKIASSELTNHHLLRACGKYNKPVFISMGMGTLGEILKAITILKSSGVKEIYPLYCVSLYPLPYNEANLKVITTLQQKTNLTVGFSDHTTDDTLALGTIALGAKIIEKHVTLKREDRLFDHSFSMEFGELKEMITRCNNLFSALGDGNQKIREKENQVKMGSRRSFFALTDIKQGEALKIGVNVHATRPVIGIPLEEENTLFGKRAISDIKKGHPIFSNNIK